MKKEITFEGILIQFAERKARQRKLLLPAFVVLMMAVFQGFFSPEWRQVTVPFTLLLMPTILLFSFLNWRCPNCNKFLGRIDLKITECKHCKVQLQKEK